MSTRKEVGGAGGLEIFDMFTDSIIFKEKICCSFLPIGVGEGLPVTKLGQSVFFRGRHKCMA